MRHFVHYPNGGPFPGTCGLCGSPKDFFDTGIQHYSGGNVMLCRSCIADLAYNIDFALAAPMAEKTAELEAEIATLETRLKKVPTEIEGLIDGIRNSVANFVLAVSSSDNADSNSPVQDAERSDAGNGQDYKSTKRQPKARTEPAVNQGSAGISASSSGIHFTNGE